MDKFERDIDRLMARLRVDVDESVARGLEKLSERLVELRERNLLKINHSVLEMVVSKHLLEDGWEVEIEHEVEGISADVIAWRDGRTAIVEVETGYVPPKHALDPVDYITARIASKISRYSNHCDLFILGGPPHYAMPILECLTVDPALRTGERVREVKGYCDMYYSNPPVSHDEIRGAKVDLVHIIEVESLQVKELDAGSYVKRAAYWYR